MSKLTAAAIRWKGVTYTGVRHGYIIEQLVKVGQLKNMSKDKIFDKDQGFMTSDNLFVDRETAKIIAIQAGQIPEDFKGVLYSEDLW